MRLALGSEGAGPKTSSSFPSIGIVVSAGKSLDVRVPACGPENRGAGGNGRFGLVVYFEEGVPGRGMPLISTGS